MPLWGWVAIGVIAIAILLPIKLRILKKLTQKKSHTFEDEE